MSEIAVFDAVGRSILSRIEIVESLGKTSIGVTGDERRHVVERLRAMGLVRTWEGEGVDAGVLMVARAPGARWA